MGPVILNIFISAIDSGNEHTLNKFGGTKLSVAVDTTKRRDAIQRDMGRLEKHAHMHLMRFKKGKCKMLLFDQSNPRYV